MSYLGAIEAQSLRLEHHAAHQVQGEDGVLTLLQHDTETGGLTEIFSLQPGQFTVETIQNKFDAVNDNATSYQRKLTIDEAALPVAQVKYIAAVRWNGRDYVPTVEVYPEGLTRFWQFSMSPVESNV